MKNMCGPGRIEDMTAMIQEHPLMNMYWEDKIAQLEKINLLWIKHSNQKDVESLRKFVSRILHVDLLQSIQSNQVHILVKAIENLK